MHSTISGIKCVHQESLECKPKNDHKHKDSCPFCRTASPNSLLVFEIIYIYNYNILYKSFQPILSVIIHRNLSVPFHC